MDYEKRKLNPWMFTDKENRSLNLRRERFLQLVREVQFSLAVFHYSPVMEMIVRQQF